MLLLETIIGPTDTQCWFLDLVVLGAMIYNTPSSSPLGLTVIHL